MRFISWFAKKHIMKQTSFFIYPYSAADALTYKFYFKLLCVITHIGNKIERG